MTDTMQVRDNLLNAFKLVEELERHHAGDLPDPRYGEPGTIKAALAKARAQRIEALKQYIECG